MSAAPCRFCGAPLRVSFADLGMSPLSNSFLKEGELNRPEAFYPLHARACERCLLVQLDHSQPAEQIFTDDYAYFSSYSDLWLKHASDYVDYMCGRFGYGAKHYAVEIASNDGYLLQYFARRGVAVLGVEPAANVAKVAEEKGIPTLVKFFGRATARELVAEGRRADLILGNNVLAQVHDINDFVAGLQILLAPGGIVTIEFPHLERMVAENEFDTIYHEHFSYFSLYAAERIFAAHGLTLFDVEELPTHGGSLRIYARHGDEPERPRTRRLLALRDRELAGGVNTPLYYAAFEERVRETKRQLLEFLIRARREGKRVVGYGAPGKGNTLLNYCGIRTDFLEFTVDRSPHKQGKFLPGTHVPILHPDRLRDARPDYVLILPWNLKDEIAAQLTYVREWGGRLVVPIPETTVLP